MSSSQSGKNPYSRAFKRLYRFAAVVAFLLPVLLAFSGTVQAGLFSSMWAAVISDRQASAKTYPPAASFAGVKNYLQVAEGPLAISASASTTPPLVDDNAISPEVAESLKSPNLEPLNTQISTYVVRKGDSISSVAKMFDVSVNTVLWANDLTSRSVLREGDTLIILPVSGINYTVRSGDTIQSIAKKYKADVTDIFNYNDLTPSSVLRKGDIIIIPNAEAPELSAPVRKKLVIGDEPVIEGWGWPSAGPDYYSCPAPGARLTQGLHGRNAVDLAITRGTPVRAAAAGTVIISRSNGAWNGGYGNFVVILHPNGTQTLYSHNSKNAVSVGQAVAKGETIAYIGTTGLTTGPHVHFEIRGAQNPFVDPSLCR